MTATTLFWSLFFEPTQTQIDGLTFSQARAFLDTQDAMQRASWFAWHEGLTGWKRIDEFVDLQNATPYQRFQSTPIPAKPVPPAAPARSDNNAPLEYDPTSSNESIQLEGKVYVDNRLHRRFLQSYQLLISFRGTTLKNETADISLGGCGLVHSVPIEVGTSFEGVLFRTNGETLPVTCALIDEDRDRKRVRFRLDESRETVLRTWILSAAENAG